tara:strand:- start:3925 stop:4863 length:939 start_codon:yes stop_codon:yes gene_type:complete
MITELTQEQEQLLEETKKKWYKIGVSTDTADRPLAEEAMAEFYTVMEQPKSPEFVWCDSPLSCLKEINTILWKKEHGDTPIPESELTKYHQVFSWGQFDAYWVSFYLFCLEIGCKFEKEHIERLQIWQKLVRACAWTWAFDTHCFISERPLKIWCNEDLDLHHDGGPSMVFRDGYGVFALNGVRVPDWLAVQPEGEIDPKLIARISNAELRREFVRKVGVERIYHKLGGETLDEQDGYKLVLLDIGQNTDDVDDEDRDEDEDERVGNPRPYLFMENPSIQTWHMEGVPPDTKTVAEALAFRNGTNDKPEVLT